MKDHCPSALTKCISLRRGFPQCLFYRNYERASADTAVFGMKLPWKLTMDNRARLLHTPSKQWEHGTLNSPAGQNRCSGPSNFAKFTSPGTESSLSVRWAGWSWSWLVPVSATDDSRSKESSPSGLGYAIGVHSEAGRNALWSPSGKSSFMQEEGEGRLGAFFFQSQCDRPWREGEW